MRNREIERCECPDLPDYELVQEFAVQSEDARSAFLPYNRADLSSFQESNHLYKMHPTNQSCSKWIFGRAGEPTSSVYQPGHASFMLPNPHKLGPRISTGKAF